MFIPALHFEDSKKKLTPEWCLQAINYYFYNQGNRSLLAAKNVKEIDEYAAGSFDLKPYYRMFKSLNKKIKQATMSDGSVNMGIVNAADTIGVDWSCLPLIPSKLNSAVATVSKIPIEATVKAADALAMEKKRKDIAFLKNKPKVEAMLAPLAAKMGMEVDLGKTQHSTEAYDDAPLGFDLLDPDEEAIFSNIIYSLKVETAFQKALQQMYNIKKCANIKKLEITDQLKYGVSCHQAFISPITGMPDVQYVHPGNVSCPDSYLPDFSDNTHRIVDYNVTVMELFNCFGDEIDKDKLDEIINGKDKFSPGYTVANGRGYVDEKNWDTFKVNLKYMEVKTVDWVGIERRKGGRNAAYLTTDPNAKEKVWGQNTIGFWWLYGTKHIFGIHKLGYAHRCKGNEVMQGFSTNIYKSQPKSAVELSIGENKKAQIAEIKLQHAIIKSLPAGKYIDLRFLRSALSGLKEENSQYTMNDLINLAFEQNIVIGDTEGFDGKNDGQLKPLMELAGGLRAEVTGYLQIIAQASHAISNYTGINEQLSGQSANPEGLIGMQKLLINSSINAINYINDAIKNQYQSLFNIWGSLIQKSIEKGGEARKGIVALIGADDTDLLDSLDETPLHRLTISVDIGQREEERARVDAEINMLRQAGIINSSDIYLLNGISNPQQKFAILAVKEKRAVAEARTQREEQMANQQAAIAQQGEYRIAAEQQKAEGEKQKVVLKAQAEEKLLNVIHSLNLTEAEVESILKRQAQRDRIAATGEAKIAAIREKAAVEAAKPL